MRPKTKNKSENCVLDYYEKRGYSAIKNGWPDFLIFNQNELIFVEVKKDRNRAGLSKRQKAMALLLKRVAIEVKLMRPKDCV